VAHADECCGLTWVSTGQLPQARTRLARLLRRLVDEVPPGVPVVGLEPSCLALLRVDSGELLRERPLPPERFRTLAEHLTELEARGQWKPPDLRGVTVVAQPHCHHASVLGWSADENLLRRTGATLTRVSGCCGLAGDFGMTAGHYEVSAAVFDSALGPAVRSARRAGEPVVLADGFSCRTQLADFAGARALHLASLLAFERLAPQVADHAV